MQSARQASLRLIGLAMVGCVLLPTLLLASGAFTISRTAHREADERLTRTADILHEQALKVFESTDVLLENLLEMTRGVPDAFIRTDFRRWHDTLRAMSSRLPQVQSIWVTGTDGRVSATGTLDALPAIDTSTRDYFAAQARADAGLFVGAVLQPLLDNGFPFFGVSRRREGPGGAFAGVVAAALLPDDFLKFYREIGSEPGSLLALMRTDGTVLVRYPAIPDSASVVRQPAILNAVAGPRDRGILTAISPLDGRQRRIAWRRVDPYPLFVMAGLETATIRHDWLGTLATHLVFGLPATLLMLAALWIAMARTRALFDEAARRAAAEDALQRAQRLEALGELTGGVAHDFNNLLMIVLGNVDRMRRRPREAGDIRALDMIVAAVQRGEALTRQLLSFARRRALFPEPIDLARQLADMHNLLSHSLRNDIRLQIETPEGNPAAPAGSFVVKVDPAEFELAVLNVAVNARDAMPQGGTLTLRLHRVTLTAEHDIDDLLGDFVALSLSDTGTGIAPEVLPRVFDPFFTTKAVGKGTGLGLSQVYGFARQSGGTATIDTRPGSGTTVTLYLPCSDELPAPRHAHPIPASAPGTGLRVLLVEGHVEVAAATPSRLEMLGFDVVVAASARAALSLLETQIFALVVTDIEILGSMSGLDLVRELRARLLPVPVILATEFVDAADRARRDGFAVLLKPYDEQHLREAVTAALFGTSTEPAGKPGGRDATAVKQK